MHLSRQFARIIGTIFLGLLTITFVCHPASAKEVSRKAFSKFNSAECPTLGGVCDIDFGTVPDKRRYEITNLACYLRISEVSAKILFWYFRFEKNGKQKGTIQLRPQALGATSGGAAYNANEQGFVVGRSGSSMQILISRDGSSAANINYVDCTIGGYIVKLK